MTRGEMMARMSARELREWMAMAALEPFGEMADDIRSGQIVATLININRGKGKKPTSVADVVIDRTTPKQRKAKARSTFVKGLTGGR